MDKKKLIVVAVALVAALGAYKFVLAKPAAAGPEPKIHGTVTVLPKEFLVNLADGRYAKVSVGLLTEADPLAEAGGGGHGGGSEPPEGYAGLHEEAVVRDLVNDVLSAQDAETLAAASGREKLKKLIRKRLNARTDLHVEDVFFPDVTVQ